MVTHIMSQTLSRITIVFHLVVVERLQKSVKIPKDETMRKLSHVHSASQRAKRAREGAQPAPAKARKEHERENKVTAVWRTTAPGEP